MIAAPKPAARWIGLIVSALSGVIVGCTTEVIIRSNDCDEHPHDRACRDRDPLPDPPRRDAGPASDAGFGWSDAGPGWSDDAGPWTDCFCPLIYAPVCGLDGNTYGNRCEAACVGVSVAHAGECEPDGGCLEPSCRSDADCPDGERCDPQSFTCVPRQTPCVCTKEYVPVCGADGRTYGNACEARCAGVRIAYPGECKGGGDCRVDEDCPHGYCEHYATCAALDCPPPPPSTCTVCGDGSSLICRMALQPCPEGQAREIVNGCYGACVDRYTCLPPKERCDYDDPSRTWVSRDPKACAAIRFLCKEGTQPFFNECGCGCEPAPTCRVGGCSSQLCVGPGDPDVSTCEYLPEYACYGQHSTCEAQEDGRCGWTPTEALKTCIAEARAEQ